MAAVACLLCLLYEGLPEELPGDVLNDAARLFQALVDGHGPHLREKRPCSEAYTASQVLASPCPLPCCRITAEVQLQAAGDLREQNDRCD